MSNNIRDGCVSIDANYGDGNDIATIAGVVDDRKLEHHFFMTHSMDNDIIHVMEWTGVDFTPYVVVEL